MSKISRSRIQEWIRNGSVRVNGHSAKASYSVKGGDILDVEPEDLTPLKAEAEDIPLTVLYEDEEMLAIDKPAGMVVHAGAGVTHGTVVNALLYRSRQLSTIGGEFRPGIVHRLDRYTSGVLIAAKTDRMHQALAALFASRAMKKTYLAMVHHPVFPEKARIEKPIARDPINRTRMTTRAARGRAAWSEYEVIHNYAEHAFLRVVIGTGRTHQIRVHLSSIRHPVVGDRLYGGAADPELGRYFLHAHRIEFEHPLTGRSFAIETPLPPELEAWILRHTKGT